MAALFSPSQSFSQSKGICADPTGSTKPHVSNSQINLVVTPFTNGETFAATLSRENAIVALEQ